MGVRGQCDRQRGRRAAAPALEVGYRLFYWTQMVVVLSFLVLLPLGEHFHIVTALPTLYFRRGRPGQPRADGRPRQAHGGRATSREMKAGVRDARDLTWKDGLDAFTCTECGRCKDACPTHLTGKPLVAEDGQRQPQASSARAAATLIVSATPRRSCRHWSARVIADETLWACTTCGYCEAACPIELEHLDKFFRMRQHQVMIDGEFPHELKQLFEAYEAEGNPWGLPAERARRLGAGPRRAGRARRRRRRGARLSVLRRLGDVVRPARPEDRARLRSRSCSRRGVRFGILGAAKGRPASACAGSATRCCSASSRPSSSATLGELGVRRIVTCDPHALNSLRNEYPELGVPRTRCVHHTQLIAELLADGRIEVDASLERVIYHDPCYLGRHNGEYDAPRAVVARLSRDAPLEFALAREKSMCCGAGGGRMWIDETIGTRINIARVEQALERSPATIATACPYCAVMMSDGLGALRPDGATRSRDIAELVADALVAAVPRRRKRLRRRFAATPESEARTYLPEGTLRSRSPWWKRRLAG